MLIRQISTLVPENCASKNLALLVLIGIFHVNLILAFPFKTTDPSVK